MALANTLTAEDLLPAPATASAVSWGAILAGAVGAAALSLIMLMLGVGLGLSSASPWARNTVGAAGLGVSTIVWVILTQLLASAMGGFLAGRLRTKWASVKSDEVFFRDTAHGFLAWAMASLATATVLTSMIASIVGAGVQGASAPANIAVTTVSASADVTAPAGAAIASIPGRTADPMAYYIDSLFRPSLTATPTGLATPESDAYPALAEISRIFQKALPAGKLPQDDLLYVSQMVSRHAGLPPPEAQQRVGETYMRMQAQMIQYQSALKTAGEKSAKAAAQGSLWLFISLLVGAFVASFSATWGGRLRDD